MIEILGLTINNRLMRTEYVTETSNKVFALFKENGKCFLTASNYSSSAKSLIMPYFTQCDTVINDMTVEQPNKL